MFLQLGPVVKVFMGLEPAFYVDSGPPTFAFNPCGHMATEKTVKWVLLPECLEISFSKFLTTFQNL